jgi:hypothetical protein
MAQLWLLWILLAVCGTTAAEATSGKPAKDPDKPGKTTFYLLSMMFLLILCE